MVPRLYWVAAGLALIWSLMGCVAYLSQVTMTEADLAALPAAQRDIWAATPAWVIGAYAVAVWSSLAASVGLLLRRRWAQPLFGLSLAAVIVQFGWTFLATDIVRTVGPGAAAFPAFIIVAAAAMLWLASYAARRRWLR
jgi:hypothetical protein